MLVSIIGFAIYLVCIVSIIYVFVKMVKCLISTFTRMITNDVLQTTERFHRRKDKER